MRRALIGVVALLVAGSTASAAPYCLDRSGTLWRVKATDAGVVLTGERDGSEIVHAPVPLPLGFDGLSNSTFHLVADEVTGKVALVWQQWWAEGYADILVAVWAQGSWEPVLTLSQNPAAFPEFPTVLATVASSEVTTTDWQSGGTTTTTVREGFLHVLWWEAAGESRGAHYALVCLAGSNETAEVVSVKSLNDLLPLGLGCTLEGTESAVQYPTFVNQGNKAKAMALFGSFESCSLHLLQVEFRLVDEGTVPNSEKAPGSTVASRKRHMPIFGVVGTYQVPQNFALDGARVVMGSDLTPVAYRVAGDTLEYVLFEGGSWSAPRTVPVGDGLTMDQAIPLVENLAR